MNYSKQNITKKQKNLVSKHTKNQHKITYLLYKTFVFLFILVVVVGAGAGLGMFTSIISTAPDITDIKESVQLEGFQTTIYNQAGEEITTLSTANSNRIYVEYEDIPENLINAFIAIEDERFWEHNGVDARGILRAFFVGIKNRNFSEGASTITQQLIKNQIFNVGLNESSFMDSLKRKIQEQYLAVELEKQIDKKDILELYLNAIYLGQGANGIKTAAETYFGKENLNELTLSECAVIAAITQSPTVYDPTLYPENNVKRKNTVLQKMLEQELINTAEYDSAMADNVYARLALDKKDDTANKTYNSYYIDTVINTLTNQLVEEMDYTETQAYNAIYSGGLSIYINQDAAIQEICDSEINNPDNYPAGTSVALNYALTLTDPTNGELYNYSSNHLVNYYKEKTENPKYNLIYSSEETARAAADEYKNAVIEQTGYKELAETFSTTIQPQSSFVILDQATGYVKAICGGRGEKTGNLTLNRATESKRQPGSTFKVLSTYVPALDTSGMTLASSFVDEPTDYSNGTPIKNWYGDYRGRQTIRTAIKDSMNIITVKCFQEVTPQVGYDYLCNMGITTLKNGETSINGIAENDINESMCLGGLTEGVTNLELTGAFASIANSGTYVQPTFYTKVLDHNGNILIDNAPDTKQVMKSTTAWLINNAMQDVVTSGTGTTARLSSGMVVAGKTGTTSSNYDYWFCGSTPYYTAGIWMGYDANTDFSNSNSHKAIWRKIMDKIVEMEGQDTSATFEKPSDIVTAKICSTSGMLPAENQCTTVVNEYFAKDTEPTKTCDLHQTVTLCNESHYKAGAYCPETTIYHYQVDDNGRVSLTDADFNPPIDFIDTECPIHTEQSMSTEDPDSAGGSGPGDASPGSDIVYTISTLVEGGGSISGKTEAKAGETVKLTFTPNDGYVISNVTVDGVAVGAVSSYTFRKIKSNHTVVVTFVASTGNEAPPDDNFYNGYSVPKYPINLFTRFIIGIKPFFHIT
ncbi:MAG: transglycosylase domain-containing protein [Bacteroidales bacterium]|nr:transglycosylase domain-containing protein [Clostridium sp.]MCM1204139.1 transglycosylase domain-containing protein [Bacteroidales bacterium]